MWALLWYNHFHMTLKRYLLTMAATTFLCWFAFGIVIFRIDPYTAGFLGLLLFFVSLFFSVWGTLSLCGFVLRFIFLKSVVPFRYIGTSLRQALWFAIILCLSLFLVTQEIYAWWMSLLLIIGFSTLEGFFIARRLEARMMADPDGPVRRRKRPRPTRSKVRHTKGKRPRTTSDSEDE